MQLAATPKAAITNPGGSTEAGQRPTHVRGKHKRRTAWRYGVEAVLQEQERYPIDASPRAVASLRMFITTGLSNLALPRLF